MSETIKTRLSDLFRKWSGEAPGNIVQMQAHGSDRKYFRLFSSEKTAIGVYNHDRKENIAFLDFSRRFHNLNLPVPEIYLEDVENDVYLEEDLGDETLFDFLSRIREEEGFSPRILAIYKKVVGQLPRFQIVAGREIDYSLCYPRGSFDQQSMMWDLNYFKYYFLKLAKIPFDEQSLEDDFHKFVDFLLRAETDFFLYRDFQSRNVMLKDGEPYFIDYQGGRKGALQYDIASLLYDAKANIPPEARDELLEDYMHAVEEHIPVNRKEFMQYYHGYVLIRITQALGAYGFRGFYERKTHFLRSVPYAIQNLERLLRTADLPVELPALTDAWRRLVGSSYLRQFGAPDLLLTVRIQSFSFKRGIPVDEKGHGGGFVFDCRALPNPGRLSEFEKLTGNDEETILFLDQKREVKTFLDHVRAIIAMSVENYRDRNFTDIMVSFGCTGGQHRSVYCANQLGKYLKSFENIAVEVRHREIEMWKQQ